MEVFAGWKNRDYSFFQHTDCEYFPCHSIAGAEESGFNCLFCYCPLYGREDCGGTFTRLECGRKDCSACVLPHKKENYGYITQLLHNTGASPVL